MDLPNCILSAVGAPITSTRLNVDWLPRDTTSSTSIVAFRLAHPFRICIDHGGLVKQGSDVNGGYHHSR